MDLHNNTFVWVIQWVGWFHLVQFQVTCSNVIKEVDICSCKRCLGKGVIFRLLSQNLINLLGVL